MQNDIVIIGLVGLPGAGKTTATEFLEKHGFVRVILSDVIREELSKEGVTEYTREILQDAGNRMRRKYGADVLVKRAMKKIRSIKKGRFVIDGIRNILEITYLQKQKNFFLIGITAPSRVRFERLRKRKIQQLTKTYKEFLEQEKRENALGAATTGLRVVDCLKACKIQVKNTKTKGMFQKNFYSVLTNNKCL